jgi:hypothetical protein
MKKDTYASILYLLGGTASLGGAILLGIAILRQYLPITWEWLIRDVDMKSLIEGQVAFTGIVLVLLGVQLQNKIRIRALEEHIKEKQS